MSPAILLIILLIAGFLVFYTVLIRKASKKPDWTIIRNLISIVKPEIIDRIESAEKQNEDSQISTHLLCEALIEAGYISAPTRDQFFEQAERLIELLSTFQKNRHDCLGRSVGYYEMIGKQSEAQVLMNELYRMPPDPQFKEIEAPVEFKNQMHNFWCRTIDGQRSIHRNKYKDMLFIHKNMGIQS
jgi:hypothetical protein